MIDKLQLVINSSNKIAFTTNLAKIHILQNSQPTDTETLADG